MAIGKDRRDNMTAEEQEFYDQFVMGMKRAEEELLIATTRAGGILHNEKEAKTYEDYKSSYIYYKEKYEAIRDASFWRMTEPLRRMTDYYRWKKTGVRKLENPDDDSTAPSRVNKGKILIGVHLHLYYEDLLDEFCCYFNNIPESFDLYISCKENADMERIRTRVAEIRNVKKVVVKETKNRGRDIAPFYVLFRKELIKYECVLHVHSKKSLYTGGEKAEWRQEALDGVLKNEKMVAETLEIMRQRSPKAGLVFGEMTQMLPPMALHWLRNAGRGQELLGRMHIPFENRMLIYPVGSFFWAKMDAIRPLYDLGFIYDDFDDEHGQIDGTLAHTLERVIACVVQNQGYSMYIYDSETGRYAIDKSYKCFQQYFTYNSQNLSDLLKREYDVITFDIFDTLITRLVYQPDDVFHLMERKIRNIYQKRVDYLEVRKEAERIAWEEKGDFCNIHHIYEKLPDVSNFTRAQAEELKQLEIDLEYQLCIPREDAREIFINLVTAGKKIVLISDMYLPGDVIANMLAKCGYQGYEELWVSCDKGKRKDRDTIWDDFLEQYGKYRTIHIGDNPHSDCQIIGDRRRQYLLLLSPIDAFRLSKQYDKYMRFVNTTVENSLVLGYLVNACLFNSPFALTERGISKVKTVEQVSKGIFAPIMLKFIEFLHRTSRADARLLFLAREGYFFEKLYVKACQAFGWEEKEHVYFLTSRRATSVAQIEYYEDIVDLFRTKYSGKLSTLLKERFGLEDIKLKRDCDIVLPNEISKVMKILLDYIPDVLRVAKSEKEAYLKYMQQVLGKDNDWSKVTLIDVGYSGTIQYYLMKILGTQLNGCYMVSGYEMKPELLDGTYQSLYTFWRSRMFLDTQLFLEAVTAAPHGQVVKFHETQGGVMEAELKPEREIYGKKAEEMQTYIFEYVELMGELLRDIQPRFDKSLAEVIFSEILRKDILDSGLRGIFSVNDGYCMDGDWIFNEAIHDWELQRNNKEVTVWKYEK